MKINNELSLKELISRQRKLYATLQPVKCPPLRKTVVFNMKGFEHLHMDGRKRRRNNKDARARLLLLEHVPKVIAEAKIMKTDYKTSKETYSRKEEVYHELYQKVGRNQALVVVTLRTIGNGFTHFYGIRYKNKRRLQK